MTHVAEEAEVRRIQLRVEAARHIDAAQQALNALAKLEDGEVIPEGQRKMTAGELLGAVLTRAIDLDRETIRIVYVAGGYSPRVVSVSPDPHGDPGRVLIRYDNGGGYAHLPDTLLTLDMGPW